MRVLLLGVTRVQKMQTRQTNTASVVGNVVTKRLLSGPANNPEIHTTPSIGRKLRSIVRQKSKEGRLAGFVWNIASTVAISIVSSHGAQQQPPR